MTREQFRHETRPRQDGVLAFTGILLGALHVYWIDPNQQFKDPGEKVL